MPAAGWTLAEGAYTGSAVITSLEANAPDGDKATLSISFEGTGSLASLNGKDFSLKYTLRAFFVFETISGYPFQFGKMLDEFLLFYSFLLASNQELFKMEFEEFIELCENDLTLFEQFKEFILDEIKLRSQSAGNDVKKKKVTTRKRKP